MKPLTEDLLQPLDKVQRAWIRKPVTLFLWIPLVFITTIVSIPCIVIDITVVWFKDCWNPSKESPND